MTLIHTKSALVSLFLVLPFVILNFIVALRLEPVYSFLGSINFLSSSPWFPALLLLLFPVAFFVVIRPMLHTDEGGTRRLYLLNILWGALILVATVFIWGGLGEDIIACDILKVPNCD